MTGSQYFGKLNSKLTDAAMHKAVISAAITVNSEAGDRIFQQGLNSEGAAIGKYDTDTPLYVNPNNSPKKFPTKGKPNEKGVSKSKFADGSNHKTGYFESYSAFRKKVGRTVSKVNLVLFGNLQSDFVKGPKRTEDGAVITLSEENNNKRLGAEERYGEKIFSLTTEERNVYTNLVSEQILKYLKDAK